MTLQPPKVSVRCEYVNRETHQRCILLNGHERAGVPEHKFKPKDAGPMVGRIARTPNCKGCGTSVNEGEKYCETCADLPQYQAPKGQIALTNQGEPPYHTQGNFRKLPPADDESPE